MNAYKTEMGRVRSNPLKLFFTLKHFLLLLFIGKIFITQDFGVYASEKIKKKCIQTTRVARCGYFT